MAPLVEWITVCAFHSMNVGKKLVIRLSIPRDQTLLHAICTHETPLVVVTRPLIANPKPSEVIETLVLANLLGIQMAMVIDNGHVLGMVVIELAGQWRSE